MGGSPVFHIKSMIKSSGDFLLLTKTLEKYFLQEPRFTFWCSFRLFHLNQMLEVNQLVINKAIQN